MYLKIQTLTGKTSVSIQAYENMHSTEAKSVVPEVTGISKQLKNDNRHFEMLTFLN